MDTKNIEPLQEGQAAESATGRKAYSPPHLRSLGKMVALTMDSGTRKRPPQR